MKLAVVLYLKDEVHIVAEWLAHYKALGFDRAYLFLNGSTDGTREIVERIQMAQPGFIKLFEWPTCDYPHDENQRRAYNHAVNVARHEGIEWLLVVDTDEFLMSPTGETVRALLERLQAFAAIGVHWRFYGSSGHVKQPLGLVTENFLRGCNEGFSAARIIKSFVRVKYCQGFYGSHIASFGPEFPYVNCRGERVGWRTDPGVVDVGPPPRFSPWFLAHYFCQSAEQWSKKALRSNTAKGYTTRSEKTFEIHDRNEVMDFTALRYSAGIRKALVGFGLPEPPWPVPKYESVDTFPALRGVS